MELPVKLEISMEWHTQAKKGINNAFDNGVNNTSEHGALCYGLEDPCGITQYSTQVSMGG